MGSLTVHFHSDNSVSYRGFQGAYQRKESNFSHETFKKPLPFTLLDLSIKQATVEVICLK